MTFCSSCGAKAVDGALFCHQCGFSVVQASASDVSRLESGSASTATCSKVFSKVSTVSSRLPSGTGPPLLSFTEFRRLKENDRQKHFNPKSKASGKRKSNETDKEKVVTCKIALMTYREDTDRLKLVRGSQHSLSVSPATNAYELRRKAVEKLSRFNRSLSNFPEHYCLLYPDLTLVCMIPGTEKPFTLKEYKDELGKPYERLTFYICKREDYLANEGIDEDDDKLSSNQVRSFSYIYGSYSVILNECY